MRIFIAVDMEGISGVVATAQVRAAEPGYGAAREYLVEDANACAEGCFRAGATEVVVWDCHGSGVNMPWHKIDGRVKLQQGGNNFGRLHDIGEFDALILLGYHALAGTPDAVLEHTMSSAGWQNFWLNGRIAGEIAIDAGLAGDAGVPTIMVSGDDTCCREAREWIPGVHTAQVKVALGRFGARLMAPEAARALITKTAEEACRNHKDIAPLKFPAPVKMRLEVVERRGIPQGLDNVPWRTIIDGRTFEVEGDSVRQAFARI